MATSPAKSTRICNESDAIGGGGVSMTCETGQPRLLKDGYEAGKCSLHLFRSECPDVGHCLWDGVLRVRSAIAVGSSGRCRMGALT